ncbi:MAG: hypothetical protein AAB533_01745 [Patescibacteria group bacterium]
MNTETHQCQNCKNPFTIEPEDSAFYERIKVPPPTFCPECRLIRRLSFHNVLNLYRRDCDLCGKKVVSRYSADKKYKVYCPHCWWSDKWDAMDYGRDYDFAKPFFEQFNELWHTVPLLGLSVDLNTALESPYVNDVGYAKDSYLIFTADTVERCMYGFMLVGSKDCVNSSFINACENSHDLFHCHKVYGGNYLLWTTNTNNSTFLWQCRNCQNCFGSANLRNKQYHFFNQPYGKEGYEQKIKEIDLGSYRIYERTKEDVRQHWLKYPVKTCWNGFSRDTTGLLVFQSRNCKECFEVSGVEDSKFVSYALVGPVKDCYDYTSWGKNAELLYECSVAGENISRVFFGEETGLGLRDSQYSKLNLNGSSDLFGCIGLRGKQFCVLNKQYAESEYKEIVARIIKQMREMPYQDRIGRVYRYGEFFPSELSPFAYNETLAYQFYPLTKEETLAKGFTWKEPEANEYAITMTAENLPDHVKDAPDSITNEIIKCLQCTRAYRIIPQELAFYRKMNVPLPRLCLMCRLQDKLKDQPNPTRYYRRVCQCAGESSSNGMYRNEVLHFHGASPCPNKFETSYAPDRPEIVYCEPCYQEEII